ncbi:hypothetical protein AX16_010079 [Volvariella volvacea WC 439]|nr:hypothetical protein AX16_010079 [Volvariella volvacea WC 439]
MPALSTVPTLINVDLSKADGPSDAKVVVVPLPKKTVGIVFGQRTAAWSQRYNSYLLNTDHIVIDPQAVWDAPSDNSRFLITQVIPPGVAPDPSVLGVGPFDDDRYIAVYCSHKRQGSEKFEQSDPKHEYQNFTIGGKKAISFTMVHAEDGGDQDYHDTVVGVAVVATTK